MKTAQKIESSSTRNTIEPIAVNQREAAHYVGLSVNKMMQLVRAEKFPAPKRVGSRCLFRVSELRKWMDGGDV